MGELVAFICLIRAFYRIFKKLSHVKKKKISNSFSKRAKYMNRYFTKDIGKINKIKKMVLLLFFVYYLAAVSLSCGMSDLSLWHTGYLVVAGGLSCSVACEILVPRPGIKHMSHVLAGRFLTTGPPEMSPKRCLTSLVFLCTQSLSHVWLCDPMDYSPGKNTEVGAIFFSRGSSLAQRLNPHLLHWQVDPLPLCHLGKHWSLGKCKLKLQNYYITIRMIIIEKRKITTASKNR